MITPNTSETLRHIAIEATAHTLAMIAVKKGRDDALWIATATLDRYLQSMHHDQIYSTQFRTVGEEPKLKTPTTVRSSLMH